MQHVLVDMSDHKGDEQALANHFIDVLDGKSANKMPLRLAFST